MLPCEKQRFLFDMIPYILQNFTDTIFAVNLYRADKSLAVAFRTQGVLHRLRMLMFVHAGKSAMLERIAKAICKLREQTGDFSESEWNVLDQAWIITTKFAVMPIASRVHIIKGLDGDKPAWYLLDVKFTKLLSFYRYINNEICHLLNFGTVLKSGYGKKVPETAMKYIKKKYGIV
jgi:hypothetical protein